MKLPLPPEGYKRLETLATRHGYLIGALAAFALLGMGDTPRENATSSGTGPSSNPLIVGINFDYPPYEFVDGDGVPTGYDVDLIKAVAAKMGRPLVIKVGQWSDMRAALARGEIDALPGMLYSPERDSDADFTASHLNVDYSIFVRKEKTGITTESDLRGKEVIVESGSLMHDRMVALGIVGEIVEVPSEPDALRLLATGAHDCALVPYQSGLAIIRQYGLEDLEPSGAPVFSGRLCIAVATGNLALRRELDAALDQVKGTDEYRRIYNRWFGVAQTDHLVLREVLRAGAVILLAAALLGVAVVLWMLSLRRQVAQRTLALEKENRVRRQLEEQLYQSQKMEAVGQLAGGIAHDFNNLLASIIGYADLMLTDLDQDSPLRRDLNEIRRAGERAASLTRQLLTFSRKELPHPDAVNLNTVVEGMLPMLRRSVGEHIEFALKLDADLSSTRADTSQIEQILLNLVLNARDAMPKGGTITLTTAPGVPKTLGQPNGVPVDQRQWIMLEVADTGCGMDEQTRLRAFEPFFTTKREGEGTGLGLAMVYGIVQQHGAEIELESTPGLGTRFRLFFPRSDAPVETTRHEVAREPVRRGTETVLVVEDEASVRELTSRMLARHGYTVLQASRGDEALEVFNRQEGPLHLLLTDVVLPRMNGPEIAEMLRKRRPDLKVIFMSGYANTVMSHYKGMEEGLNFIQKPFLADALLRLVRNVLDEQ
ncbi:MAG: transporter substrate-binding domain-containing protein [Candidatus Hydrogenedentes bacterium]|nr:transporter substrate-binding domain-containing protein [Candidatus Hydrogenedentota bacterium]